MEQRHNDTTKDTVSGWWDRLLTMPQYLIPQHFLSLMMHRITRCRTRWLKNLLIRSISRIYQINLSEAKSTDLDDYPSFNHFFTRELVAGARPVAEGDAVVVSPVDGAVSQLGTIEAGRIVQAKGHEYSVAELLADDGQLAAQFEGGQFATIYLSPRDYHRIHMPLTGTLRQMTYVPGKLFSVSPRTVKTVPQLFARNERVVTVFDTPAGPMGLVLVGAIFVGSMETTWAGMITPPYGKSVQQWHYADDTAVTIEKGQEMGRFNMGSTVVLLLPKGADQFLAQWQADTPIQLGQAMN